IAAAACVGAYGWLQAASDERQAARALTYGLIALAVIPLVQLVPLPPDVLMRLSPATDAFLQRYDVAYSLSRSLHQPIAHSLSIAPRATLLGLMFLIGVGMFAMGSTAMLSSVSLSRLVN